jgi:hypothetical protein
MQRLRINVQLIDKSALYKGAKGTYLDITLLDNRDGTDQYGNDGMIVQDIGKERRVAGEKGAILGNWKHVGQPPRKMHGSEPSAGHVGNTDDDSALPF